MNSKLKQISLALAGAALFTLAGCGGDSSTNSNASIPAVNISGVAAVGAPLVGTVTVKDALGATKTVSIGDNGAYVVNVAGMTAPFVFRATGTVNNQSYTVYSIATSADDNKINITQLTDLVVANIAGQIAQNYFDKFEQNSNASAATKTAVDAEVAKLKEKLLPVLTALGVDASIDLLRTQFTPKASALDAALDVIQVSVDASSSIATISTLLNSTTISDDLTVKAASETSPPTLSSDNISSTTATTATTDAAAVKQVLTDFIGKFAKGLPAAADITPLLTNSFLLGDVNGTNFANAVTANAALVGGSISNITIHQIDYSDLTKITARVSFTLLDKNGVEIEHEQSWRIRKGTDGVWRLHGDQRVLQLSAFPHEVINLSSAQNCRTTGFEFEIQDFNTANNGGTIAYVMVTGPGLPAAGLRYVPPTLAGAYWKIDGQTNAYYVMGNSCATTQPVADSVIAAIPDNAFYTFTAYTAADVKITFPSGTGNGVYGLTVPRRPHTLSEVQAASFPVISAPASSTVFSTYTSGPLTITASGLNPTKYGRAYLGQNTDTGDFRDTEVDIASKADGTLNTSLSLTAAASGNINWRTMRVESIDTYRRVLSSTYAVGTQP
ncbi:hypothetical protein [Andreprevotia chitinilytica]|uniref:hypothetical protein n=1 Tax=Andreprevotia chitinilytica TaxID=396808 RepID=UPI00055379D1|nr:hypothetical protein [Andreprevotia chitinilytica]